MITNELVKQSIDYIMRHLDEEISIDDVADYCHFSKYHFSRVFKAETGESIYAFIKRLKMEHSAVRLKIEKDKSITDVGFDYGYSPSNYSSKKHHVISPSEFRKAMNTTCGLHPYYPDKHARFQSFEEYEKQIVIEEMEEFKVISERYIGNYIELGKNWSDFIDKYKDYYKEDTLLIERSYNDPSITSADQCVYDICMTVNKNGAIDHVTSIQGHKYAVYRFAGLIQDIFGAFLGIFNIWLPNSRYEMNERYCLGIYRTLDIEKMQVVMDLCIPIK